MKKVEKFIDAADAPEPSRDGGSLRPHAFTSAPPSVRIGPDRSSRSMGLGVIMGLAASLPLTAWLFHMQLRPGDGSISRALHTLAAPILPAPAPEIAPPPVQARVPDIADVLAARRIPASDSFAQWASASKAPKKVHKKHKTLGSHATAPAVEAQGTPASSAVPVEVQAATELENAAAAATLARTPIVQPPHTAPAGPVEDEAAAELSRSLK